LCVARRTTNDEQRTNRQSSIIDRQFNIFFSASPRLRGIVILGIAFAVLSGCASTHYNNLVSEREIPELVDMRAQAERFSNHRTIVPTQLHEEQPVVDVAIYDTGMRDAERTIILVHGVLSDHSIWRYIRGGLGSDHRLILVDLPGVGASGKPAADELGEDGYTPLAVGERLLQALRQYFEMTDVPQRITLVGHSFGGAVAIQMAGHPDLTENYQDVVERIDRLILFTPADVEITSPPSLFVEIATTTDAEFWLAENTGILRERIAKGIATMFCAGPGIREEADTLVAMLSDPATRAAQQAILRQFVPMTNDDRIDWSRVRHITRSYGEIDVPTLIVWGRYDETLPIAMGYKLAFEIPDATLHIIPSCMHSAPLERPRETMEIIREFSRSGEWKVNQ
jgi:pimeloyl-ACP methyl ester carboxylesterase